ALIAPGTMRKLGSVGTPLAQVLGPHSLHAQAIPDRIEVGRLKIADHVLGIPRADKMIAKTDVTIVSNVAVSPRMDAGGEGSWVVGPAAQLGGGDQLYASRPGDRGRPG